MPFSGVRRRTGASPVNKGHIRRNVARHGDGVVVFVVVLVVVWGLGFMVLGLGFIGFRVYRV